MYGDQKWLLAAIQKKDSSLDANQKKLVVDN
jgi:hypothetical protein